MSIRFSTRTRFGIRRLKIEADYGGGGCTRCAARERVWVERWLHMIDRSLTRQPQAASAIVETATMIKGAWRGLPPGARRLARDHRRRRQTELRRRPRLVRSCRRDRRSSRCCDARSAAGGAQAQDRRDQDAGPGGLTDSCFTRISAAPRCCAKAAPLLRRQLVSARSPALVNSLSVVLPLLAHLMISWRSACGPNVAPPRGAVSQTRSSATFILARVLESKFLDHWALP